MIGLALVLILAGIGVTALLSILFRRVVPPNETHIVQTAKRRVSYGKEETNGNVYYEWPSWVPVIGIVKKILPISVFDCRLQGYEAYDKDRVPFVVDVVAFFRVHDSIMASERIENFVELQQQLQSILQGAIRTVLASHNIDSIMIERSKFGEQFTKEVQGQLPSWGVETVKSVELMDVRDSGGNKVIHNIMEMRKSAIEKESRVIVASNMKEAEVAEISAKQEVDIKNQEAEKIVGEKTAETQRDIGIANEKAKQEIKSQEKETMERAMDVQKVENVRKAEIIRDVQVVKAEEERQTSIIKANGQKEQTVIIAEGDLKQQELSAKGIQAEGAAKADAEKQMGLAKVQPQIELAEKIGSNQPYQDFLIRERSVQKDEAVGIEQAKAMEKADIKIIANTGGQENIGSGLSSVMDLFTPKGGTNLAGMLEGLAQSPEGEKLIQKVTGFVDSKPKK